MGNEGKKKFFSAIGMLAAVITIIAYLLLVVNAQWPFLGDVPTVYNVLVVIKAYAPLVVVAITGLEWVAGKCLLVRVLFYLAIALIVVSMFFPSTWSQFVGFIK